MKYKNLSITAKVPVMMAIGSLTALAVVCLLLMMPLRSNSLEDATEIARSHAEHTKERLVEHITSSANVVRAYSQVIAQSAASEIIPKEQKRELLLREMKILFDSNVGLKSMWCILEPDALDGMDEQYIHRTGGNSQGLFALHFIGNKVTPIELMNSTNVYEVPRETELETVESTWIEIDGERVQTITISVPIMLNGEFLGVIAADFITKDLSNLAESTYSNMQNKIVTDKGMVAAHYDEEQIGSKAEQDNREILAKIAEGRTFEGIYPYKDKLQYKVYVPMRLSADNKPWFFAVDLPVSAVYNRANQTIFYLIIYFLLGVVLISLTGWALVRPILKQVKRLTDIIRKLSLGIIHLKIADRQSLDEIGVMETELGSLVKSLKNATTFATGIGEGNLDVEYHLSSDEDALGNSLLEMRRRLQEAEVSRKAYQLEEQQRNWIASGLAKFSEILRHDNDHLETFSYNIISNMVKYLDANQGGIFILNDAETEADRVLEMTACYAYDRKKFAEKRIYPGEGLVGTCYLEGEPIYMNDIPDKYITITSGLGDANPKAILICPLKVNDVIYGVIELASFSEFEPYHIEFVQKICESIASAISSVKVNIRTNQLLAQSKQQAEEMANQEEELRQNMEEMQATQEEMQRRESELQETINELRKTE